MGTKTFHEMITRNVDVCDFCGMEGGLPGSNKCRLCDRSACARCGSSDAEYLLSSEIRSWLCNSCNSVGLPFKESIRRLWDEVVEQRRLWRDAGKQAAKETQP